MQARPNLQYDAHTLYEVRWMHYEVSCALYDSWCTLNAISSAFDIDLISKLWLINDNIRFYNEWRLIYLSRAKEIMHT